MVYIDLNMVRAGVVRHPSEWKCNGYNEIMNPAERYGLIDQNTLLKILGQSNRETLIQAYSQVLDETIRNNSLRRQEAWTESIAVGDKAFI